jgi:hypothetical protein
MIYLRDGVGEMEESLIQDKGANLSPLFFGEKIYYCLIRFITIIILKNINILLKKI